MGEEKMVKEVNPIQTYNYNSQKDFYNEQCIESVIAYLIVRGLQAPIIISKGFETNDKDFSYTTDIDLGSKAMSNNQLNPIVDLTKMSNLNKIDKMSQFTYNWNGTGGKPFTENAIKLFKSVIEKLEIQPEIAPTGRNSLYMQYESYDESILAFEVGTKETEMACIPKGDYAKAYSEVFVDNVCGQIEESVKEFYGYK